jgi:hypothetical protein
MTIHVIVAKDGTTLNTPLVMSLPFSGRQGICSKPFGELLLGATAMDDIKFLQLLRINGELNEICQWLNENRHTTLASRIVPITEELTRLVLELSVEPFSKRYL